jgi:L-malate glycosyltransferase
VLATNVGGLAEVVVDGLTGFLFPVGDHASAVDLAVGLLSDPTRYRAMGEAAAIHARRFGQKRIVTAYEKLYHRLLRNRSHGEPQPEVRLEGEI